MRELHERFFLLPEEMTGSLAIFSHLLWIFSLHGLVCGCGGIDLLCITCYERSAVTATSCRKLVCTLSVCMCFGSSFFVRRFCDTQRKRLFLFCCFFLTSVKLFSDELSFYLDLLLRSCPMGVVSLALTSFEEETAIIVNFGMTRLAELKVDQ